MSAWRGSGRSSKPARYFMDFVHGADWLLDTNKDGSLNGPDDFVSISASRSDTIIDLGAALGGDPGEDTITVLNNVGLWIDDFVL